MVYFSKIDRKSKKDKIDSWTKLVEPWHEISYTVVFATNKASDQPAHTRSLIRDFASRSTILWMKPHVAAQFLFTDFTLTSQNWTSKEIKFHFPLNTAVIEFYLSP